MTRRATGFAALALAALAAMAAHWLPAPLAACALALALLVAPGAALADALWPRDATARWAGAIALSPFVAGAPFALLLLAGMPVVGAARTVALLVAVACAWQASRPGPQRAGEPVDSPDRGVVWIANPSRSC